MRPANRRPPLPAILLVLLLPLLALLSAASCDRGSSGPQAARSPQEAVAQPAAPAPAATAPAAPPRQPANVMPFHGAAWLEREGRVEEERPDEVLQAMDLAPGMQVAEVGAGTGFFARRIGPVVAPGGKVYAVDIQAEMLDLLREYSARDGVDNVVPVLGTEVDPKLPRGAIDRLLLVDVYHEFQQPAPMLQRMRESLAPGGRVVLVEYRAEDDSAAHIKADHRMTVDQVLAEWLPAGFELVERRETLPSQHLFVFRARP
ncbi:MAG TPA: methyltransferase domain-containing protein [Thermoanaerobaculia bacterium]|nr:methyltransferase domain-containing protein [Thermoanaerobaculia bacterium]